MKMTMLSSVPPCHRSLLRFVSMRRRPVALLLVGLAAWLALYLFSIHGSSVNSSSLPESHWDIMQRLGLQRQVPNQLNPVLKNTLNITTGQQTSKDSNATVLGEDLEVLEKEFRKRRQHYRTLCQTGLTGPVGDIHYYQPAKLALCLVPKVGSTYWQRVLHFLYKDTDGRPAASPLDVDRYHVHFGSNYKAKVTTYYRSKAMLDTFHKVMFVRDPWSRLWSSYVDKLVLPDSWHDHGLAILGRRSDRSRTKHCADDVRFVEFLDYVVNANRDAHWRPVSKICNPCVYQPEYIGKVETFAEDTQHILHVVGLHNLTQGKDAMAIFTEDQVRQITDYHFRLLEVRLPLQRCLSPSRLAKRLWQAFVFNGYIDPDLTFPREEFTKALDGDLKVREAGREAAELLVKYHKRSPSMTSRQMGEYRRSVLSHAYRKAPRDLLEKLADIFNADFTLFDYDPRPSDIFLPFGDSVVPSNSSETVS